MILDDVYARTALARRRLLRVIDHEWRTPDELIGAQWDRSRLWAGDPAIEDGVAVMIAINELGREGVIEFDPTWRVRLSRATKSA